MTPPIAPVRDSYPRAHVPPLPPLHDGDTAYQFGTAFLGGRELPFYMSPARVTRVHMAVLGESGSGKSKFLELYARHLLMLGEAGMLIDPPKDLADALASFVAYRAHCAGDAGLLPRVHFLDVTDDRAFRFDPFVTLPRRSAAGKFVFDNALDVKADRVVRQVLRRVPAEAFEQMKRLRPRLKAVVMACGADLDGRGTHLGLGRARSLANPLDPHFEHFLALAYPHLPRRQQAAFREIMGEKVPVSARDRWESTQNALDDLLGGYADLILEPSPHALNVAAAVARGEFLVVGIGQSGSVSYDRSVALGGLLMDAVLEAKEAEEELPPHLRKRCTLIVDEVSDYLGEDLCWALRNDRKFELRIVVGSQNVSSLARGDLDLSEFVLSQCQTVLCFAQKLRTDKEVIEDRLWGGSYRLTPMLARSQYQDGYVSAHTRGTTTSQTDTKTWNTGRSRTESESRMESVARARGWNRTWADARGQTNSSGHTDGVGEGRTKGEAETLSASPIVVGGHVVGAVPTAGESESLSVSRNRHSSDTTSRADSRQHTEGGGESESTTETRGHSVGLSRGETETAGGSRGTTRGESVTEVLLANIVTEWVWNGRYEEGTVADQKEMNMVRLHALRQAECFVSVYGHPFAIPVRIDFVDPLWDTPEEAHVAGRNVRTLLAARRGYTFSPRALGLAGHDAADATTAVTPRDGSDAVRGPFARGADDAFGN